MEGYKGLGRKNRRLMLRLWKASGSRLSLKAWARNADVGDVARVWIEHKRSAS